jgi:hypothetical protein
MAVLCQHCASPKTHRSHRYGVDYVASALFGYFPYRCSACNRRFRAKRTDAVPDEVVPTPPVDPAAAASPAAEPTERRRRSRSGRHRTAIPAKKKTKRAFLRELLLYGLALAGFLAFLRWISEDHPSQPPQQ